MIIITEKTLPAASQRGKRFAESRARAMPSVATIIDGMRLAQGTMRTENDPVAATLALGVMESPYFNGMNT